MTDDRSHLPSRTKGRSASICATSSMEMLPPQLHQQCGGTPEAGTPQSRRRRPAARSQSARLTNSRSVKRRSVTAATYHNDVKSHCNSEPKLAEQDVTPEVSPNIRRKGSHQPTQQQQQQRRGTSVYHRKSTAFLDVPDPRNFRGGNPEEEDEDSYRLRSFSFTSKGIVNRGDSFRRRRSRSNSLCPPSMGGAGTPSPVHDEPEQNFPVSNYNVALLGAQGVGKTALISQFMTSECINAYDRQKDIDRTQTVSIMLNGEESELTFQNLNSTQEIDKSHPPDAFVVLYSVVDKASFLKAEIELTKLQDADLLRTRPAIVVANKIDLARSRAVSTQVDLIGFFT